MIIQIKDYQGIHSAKLNLKSGISVVVGKTNAGKSSIIRAIKDLLENNINDSDIRIGSKEEKAIVAIKSVERGGHLVKVTRDKNSTFKTVYNINGESIEKVGKNKLEEVDELGLFPIDGMDIHFIRQEDLPFLVFENPYKTYEFLSQSKSQKLLDIYDTVVAEKKEADSDMKELIAKSDVIKTRYEEIRNELKKYPMITEMLEHNKNLKKYKKDNSTYIEKMKSIIQIQNKALEFDSEILSYENKISNLDMKSLESATDISYLLSRAVELEKSLYVCNNDILNTSNIISNIPNVDISLNNLLEIIRDVEKCSSVLSELEKTEMKLKTITFPNATVNPEIVDNLRKLMEYSILVGNVSSVEAKYYKVIEETQINKSEIEKYQTEILKRSEELKKYEVCPTCKRPIEIGGN